MLADLGLPFRAGLDDIISLVPFWGDIISGIMQLYQVWLAWLFGCPLDICGRMVSCCCAPVPSCLLLLAPKGLSTAGLLSRDDSPYPWTIPASW